MATIMWKVWVEVMQPDGTSERRDIATVQRSVLARQQDDLRLKLVEAKMLLQTLQQHVIPDYVDRVGQVDRVCADCRSRRPLHDYRQRRVDTLFGRTAVRYPRWSLCSCKQDEAGRKPVGGRNPDRVPALLGARATPELVRIQAELGARLSFREAARVMRLLLPVSTTANHTSVRRRLATTSDLVQLNDNASPHRMSRARGTPMVVSIDAAHIRAVPDYQTRHFEVTTGRIDAEGRPARHFAVAPNVPASRPGTIHNALRAQGWLPGREVTALSDGDPSLAGAVRAAVQGAVTHIVDWFHISMRVRHIEQSFGGLLRSDLEHKAPLEYIWLDVSRLRHLIWNGYGDEARRTLPTMVHMAWNAIGLNGRHGRGHLQRFAQLVRELETYLFLNAGALVDYGRRYRAGRPVSTARAESVVNSLVNARMNKLQQMRWSPQGANRVLQVRAAVIDGRLSGGQLRLAA